MSDRSVGADLALGDPRVWRALLAAHVADPAGRCRTCRRSGYGAQRWPCSLWPAATRACEIVGEARG